MEPEAELAIFIVLVFAFLLFSYAVLNNSPWFARWVKIFRFKSEEELEGKQSDNSSDATSTKVEEKDSNDASKQ